jgi:hypothetical protein
MTNQFVAAQHAAMHSHPPMLVVNLGVGRQKVTWADGTTQIVDLNPGAVVWREDAFDHAWELLAGEVDVILVESGRQTSGKKTSVRQMPFVSGSFGVLKHRAVTKRKAPVGGKVPSRCPTLG